MCSVQIPMSGVLVLVQNAGEIWKSLWFTLNSTVIRPEHSTNQGWVEWHYTFVTWQVRVSISPIIVLPPTAGCCDLALPQRRRLTVCTLKWKSQPSAQDLCPWPHRGLIAQSKPDLTGASKNEENQIRLYYLNRGMRQFSYFFQIVSRQNIFALNQNEIFRLSSWHLDGPLGPLVEIWIFNSFDIIHVFIYHTVATLAIEIN